LRNCEDGDRQATKGRAYPLSPLYGFLDFCAAGDW